MYDVLTSLASGGWGGPGEMAFGPYDDYDPHDDYEGENVDMADLTEMINPHDTFRPDKYKPVEEDELPF